MTLGWDTVSCNCGTADCYSFCNSDFDMEVVFRDNNSGETIASGLFKWLSPNVVIEATSSDDIGSYSVKVTSQL